MDQSVVIGRMEQWTQNFALTLGQWEDWIERTQMAFLHADYPQLERLQADGEATLRKVRERYEERREILDFASEMGLHFRSLQDLAMSFWGDAATVLTQRLASCGTRMRRLQQASMAVWITAFESSVHSAQFLQILTTGEAETATYSPNEGECMGGGKLVDQAA